MRSRPVIPSAAPAGRPARPDEGRLFHRHPTAFSHGPSVQLPDGTQITGASTSWPTPAEVDLCGRYMMVVRNRREVFEDILWSLVNSTEFVSRR